MPVATIDSPPTESAASPKVNCDETPRRAKSEHAGLDTLRQDPIAHPIRFRSAVAHRSFEPEYRRQSTRNHIRLDKLLAVTKSV